MEILFKIKFFKYFTTLPGVLPQKYYCATISTMSNSKKSENIKEKAKETTQKAKEQLDSIIEKKPIDNIKLPLPAKIFAVLCIIQCVFTAPIAYNYIVEFI